jgi:hypothetical protein
MKMINYLFKCWKIWWNSVTICPIFEWTSLKSSVFSKHRTFPSVFRFTPFFWIFRGKFTVVKFTLGHRKFIAVRKKNGVNSKKPVKNVNLRSWDKFLTIQTIILKSKNYEKYRGKCEKAKNLRLFSAILSHLSQCFLDFLQIFSYIKGTSLVWK